MKKMIFCTGIVGFLVLASQAVFAAEKLQAWGRRSYASGSKESRVRHCRGGPDEPEGQRPDTGVFKAPRSERPGRDQEERICREGEKSMMKAENACFLFHLSYEPRKISQRRQRRRFDGCSGEIGQRRFSG